MNRASLLVFICIFLLCGCGTTSEKMRLPSVVTMVRPANYAALTAAQQAVVNAKIAYEQEVNLTTNRLLADLDLKPTDINTAVQDADSDKTIWTVIGFIGAGGTAIAAGGSPYIIQGLAALTGITTFFISHFGDRESACVTTAQVVLQVQQYQVGTDAKIQALPDSATSEEINSLSSAVDSATQSVTEKVSNSLTKCPKSS